MTELWRRTEAAAKAVGVVEYELVSAWGRRKDQDDLMRTLLGNWSYPEMTISSAAAHPQGIVCDPVARNSPSRSWNTTH